jgi:hypothetical protein
MREFERIEKKSNATTLHFDIEAARQEGLAAPVATGPYIMQLVHKSALEFFGAGWVKGGRADLTVTRPTYPGSFVVASGFVTEITEEPDGRRRAHLKVKVEDQTGDVKVAGTVSGLLP